MVGLQPATYYSARSTACSLRVRAARLLIGLTALAVAATALGEPAPPCASDPSRVIFAGFKDSPCKKFHGDQATCEAAYYVNASGDTVSCGFVAGTCVGCGGYNGGCATNTCDGSTHELAVFDCDGDPGRSALLGHGDNGSERCRNLDQTDQVTCENAYYADPYDDRAVSCWWDSGNGHCLGCNDNSKCPFNMCDADAEPADANCTHDAGRGNLVGFGGDGRGNSRNGGACRQLDGTDRAICEDAFYEDEDSGLPVACWWDGDQCRGSGADGFPDHNECLGAVAVVATATCAEDPGRGNLLGFGGNDTGACRQFDGTDQATCEDAFYQDLQSGLGVACWWTGSECRGSGDDFYLFNACQRTPATADATCVGDVARTNLLGFGKRGGLRACRQLDGTDPGTCENAFYEGFSTGRPVACAWEAGLCRGCGGRNGTCGENACFDESCAGDPTRMDFVGFGNNGSGRRDGACRQLDGTSELECEDAFYENVNAGKGVACWWDGGDCRGTTRGNSGEDECYVPAQCGVRSNPRGLAGNGEQPCRAFDYTDQGTCEDAFYEDAETRTPVACWWDGDQCLGSRGRFHRQNACRVAVEPATAECAGEPGRNMLLGFGSNRGGQVPGVCGVLTPTDAMTCNGAFYENAERRSGVACWWDGTNCLGSSGEYAENDACYASSLTCTRDPGRNNLLGFGSDDSGQSGGACRQLDSTDQATCEDAFYENAENRLPIACWWDGDQCRGSSEEHFTRNECLIIPPTPPTATAICTSMPARNTLIGFGNGSTSACRILDSAGAAACEDAFYEHDDDGFAVACWWDGDECRGTSTGSNALHNDCAPPAVTCTEDPGRSNLVGFGNNDSGNSGGACRQLDGVGQMECEDAYYVSQSNLAPVACWWDGDECRGSSSQYSALNACRHAIAECEGDQGRTNLLGGGNGRSHCRQLDGIGQMECENAFYVTGGGGGSHAVACTWAAGADWCLGTGLYDALNACDPDMSPPACSGDVGRTDLIGRGGRSNQDIGNNGGACGQFGDETDCVDAYYINDRDQAVACWWDGGGCRGSNRDNKLMNACFVAAASCSGRSTAIGFGHDNSGPCRNFDYSSEGECEDAFYEAADGGRAVACEWDAGSSHCYGCGYGPRPGGETTCTENVCAPITCDGAPGRGQVRACRDLRDQGACEDAWHTTGGGNNPLSGPTFAAACVWSDAGFCYGCGLPSQSGKECANSCAPSCGNGQLDGGEQCDDGNMFVGDCCDANCQFETEGSTCTDRLFCTEGAGTCQAGECVGAPERLCASCLADDCNELDNSCDAGFARRRGLGATAAATQGLRQRPNGGGMSMPEPEGTFCDDGVDGTANATCNAFGMCVAEPAFVPPAQAPALDRWGYALLLIALFGLSVRSLRRRRR